MLVIDDEAAMGRILIKSLALDGLQVVAYTDPAEALEAIRRNPPDVIVTDVRMPKISGHEILEIVKKDYPEIPVLIMTAHGTIEAAVASLKAGAFNYITKPFQHEDLVQQITRALEQRHREEEIVKLSDQAIPQREAREIIGSSTGLARVHDLIGKAAKAAIPVLITGESGVGKELVARELHRQSPRRDGRFVTVNCPAIPAQLIESELFGYERGAFTGADRPKMGLIELSAGGSLFLDEIGELPTELQVKLLRVIEAHEIQRLGALRQIPVDLRIIAATNRDLKHEIKTGRFRSDLYYRLNVLHVPVPPLRERPEDIRELTEHFLARIERRNNLPGLRVSEGVARFFEAYAWPGNIRELENILSRMAIFSNSPLLDEQLLPADLFRGLKPPRAESGEEAPSDRASSGVGAEDSSRPGGLEDFKEARQRFERSYLQKLMKQCDGNVALASRLSGIARRTLYEKFERLGLDKDSDS